MVRRIVTELSEDDYRTFCSIANYSGLSVEEKIQEIVDVYILVEQNRFRQSSLDKK